MNSLKLIIPVLCMVPLSVYGSGSPADILGGQFQILKERIIKRSIDQTEAQKTFTQLTNAIPPQKLNSYQGIINQTITEAKKRGILLTIKGAPAYAKTPTDIPAQLPKKPKTIEIPTQPKTPTTVTITPKESVPPFDVSVEPQPTTTVTQSVKKNTPALPAVAGGNKKSESYAQENKNQKPTEYTEKKHPGEADQPIPLEKLSDAQFNEIKNKLKDLKKYHKIMGPKEIGTTIAAIQKDFGTVSIPLYIQKTLERIERFKAQLSKDLDTIATLSNKLIDTKLPQLKNKLTDPKVIKNLALDAHMIKKEIEPFEAAYSNNNTIQTAALQATTKTIYDNLYTIMQESMKQAAQLKDTALLNKLIRAYAFVAKEYPVYSEKYKERKRQEELSRIEQQEKEKQEKTLKNKSLLLLQKLKKNDAYKQMEPEVAEELLQAIAENHQLLTPEDNNTLKNIEDYLLMTFDTIDAMRIADEDIVAIQQTLKKNDIDLTTINTALKTIRTLNRTWKEELKETILLHKDSWLNTMLAQFIKVIEEAYKAATAKEIGLFNTLITNTKQFIARNPTDPEEVYNKEDVLDIIRKHYNKEYTEADPIKDEAYRKELNQKIDSIDTLAEQLLYVRDELEKKIQEQEEAEKNRRDELAFIQQESEKLEKEGAYRPGNATFAENPTLRALDTKKIPASPGYEKVKTEAEESVQRLLELGEQRRQKEAFEAQQKAQETQRQKNLIRSDL